MRTSIATVCVSGTLEEKLTACAAAGFDGIELFEADLVASPLAPEEVRARAADLGLSLELYQPFRDVEGVEDARFEENLRRARAKFCVMERLGMDLMLVCSNVGTATIDDDGLAAEQLHRLGQVAAEHGVRVAYEALAWGRYVNTYGHAWDLVRAADHPGVGTCLDSFHILSRGDDPAGIEQVDGEKIFFLQLADAPRLTMDILSWSRHHRLFPGEGTWDLPGFLAHVLRAGYRGPVSLEIFNDVFRQSDERRTAVEAMRSLIWLEDQTARLGQHQPEPLQVRQPQEPALATLPDVGDPSGMSFVEVKTEDRGSIELLLSQLGFAHAGHHRSKPVQLWTQGEARIVINGQQARHWEPTIAALGFDVADPLLAASRAMQLRAAPVARPTRAGEEVLQAVLAPDGTEVFFCHPAAGGVATWSGEFEGGRAAAAPGLITHIDHVNLAQPWQHYDEAVLFYAATLSLDARPPQEVSSPTGLVRSQVMCSGDGAIRLALNVAPQALEQSSDSPRSAFPQHVAFGCTDLVALARGARERGLELLPVPGNYYDDLAARFELPDATLETLADLGLLYDRDEDGEFLHLYTETVGNVFLEVVERRRGYDGYGAPNTPVRLAAQYERRRHRNRRP